MVAKQTLSMGTLILSEEPVLTLSSGISKKTKHEVENDVQAKFETLTPDQQRQVMNLHDCHCSESNNKSLVGLFLTNYISLGLGQVNSYDEGRAINALIHMYDLGWFDPHLGTSQSRMRCQC